MPTNKYCLPIIEDSREKVLNKISENLNYDFYEIWLSYISDLDTDFIWKISDQYNGKLILLFRKKDLEKSELEKVQKEKIIKLLETSENYLDLDVNDQKEDLYFIKEEKLDNNLIVSYHNYKITPGLEEMEEIISEMDSRFRGNDKRGIYKVATFCKDSEDAVKLLTLLLKLKKDGKKFIISGMGEEGKIVRIYSALWGNEFNFAPVSDDEKSAPGQLTREKLEKILEVIN